MASTYPGGIHSFTSVADQVDLVSAADINDLQLEVAAIETELGINPPDVDDSVSAVAAAANLALRLDHIVNAIKTISGAANWYDATAAILKSLVAAKGDILGASADDTPAITTVGGNNRLLRANSGAAAGISWDRRQYVQVVAVDYTTDCAVGDGNAYIHIPAHLAGLDLVEVHAEVITAGTTGTMTVQIRNVTDTVDMLSTKLTINTGETGSDEYSVPAVIETSDDDIAENDLLAVDIDTIHTTAAKGLILTLGFA